MIYRKALFHSAKGTTWKNHKYIKKEDGRYYYPGDKVSAGEYSKNDSDFDEKNYSDENLLGDTDFYGFQREDGTYVILNEDFKWSLQKGTKITPDVIKRLESFSGSMELVREKGRKISNDNYKKMVTATINNDVDEIAKQVIKGNFGNGKQRKELLGSNYDAVQKRVNEMIKKK